MTEVKRKNGLKEILVSSVAVMGLSVGVAEGQEVGLQGMMEGGKYGGGARVYMPFGGISSGSVFLGLNGGMVGGKMNGSGVLGYGKGFGDWGVRGYVGAGVEEGKRGDLYTGLKVGGELYVGGFGVRVGGHVAVGDKKKEVVGRRVEGVLVDPSGQQCDPTGTSCVPVPASCTNPVPGQVKRCEVGVAITNPSYERALSGFEAEVSYMIPVGSAMITPSLGYERYGKNEVVGLRGGVRIDVPLTSGLSLNVEGGVRKGLRGEENGTTGYAGLGIRYNFGSVPVHQMSMLERRMSEGTKIGNRGGVIQTTKGETTIYRNEATNGQGLTRLPPGVGVTWKMNPRGQYITSVYVVDSANEKNLDDIVAAAPADAIVVVDGRVVIDGTLKIKNDGVGIAGAGNALSVRATFDGGKTFIDTVLPVYGKGRRGVIDGGTLPVVIEAVGVDSPILYGLDLKGGGTSVAFNNIINGQMEDIEGDRPVTLMNLRLANLKDIRLQDGSDIGNSNLLNIVRSYGVELQGISLKNAWSSGLAIDGSSFIKINALDITGSGASGINIKNSNNLQLKSLLIQDSYISSIRLENAENIMLDYGVINKSEGDGVVFAGKNSQIEFKNMWLKDIKATGIVVSKTDHDIKFDNLGVFGSGKFAFYSDGANITVERFSFNKTGGVYLDNFSSNNKLQDGLVDGQSQLSWVPVYAAGKNHVINNLIIKGFSLNSPAALSVTGSGHFFTNIEVVRERGHVTLQRSDILLNQAENVILDNITVLSAPDMTFDAGAGQTEILLTQSRNIKLNNLWLSTMNRPEGAIIIDKSQDIQINQAQIIMTAGLTGIRIAQSQNVNLKNIRIVPTASGVSYVLNGVQVMDSKKIVIDNLQGSANFAFDGLKIEGSEDVAINNSSVNAGGNFGLIISNSQLINVRNLNIYHRADSRGSTAIAIAWDGTRSSAPSIANFDGVIIFTDGVLGSSTKSRGLSVGDKSVASLRAVQVIALREGLNTTAFEFSRGALLQDKGMNMAQGFNTPPSSVCDGVDDAITNVAIWDGRRTVYCQ